MLNKYDIKEKTDMDKFKNDLFSIINSNILKNKIIIFYFIGTDRCTGDSLGPIIGENFKSINLKNIIFCGSLESPVHAVNLEETINRNKLLYKKSLNIAVDASLSSEENFGKVFLEDKPLKPGSALNKKILSLGDYSITGIVNSSNRMDFIILQNTRLYDVFQLSYFISEGIKFSISEYIESKKAL